MFNEIFFCFSEKEKKKSPLGKSPNFNSLSLNLHETLKWFSKNFAQDGKATRSWENSLDYSKIREQNS